MRTEGPSLPATPSITRTASRGVPACRHPLHHSKREWRGPSACRHPLRCLKCERRALSACHPLHRSKCDCHAPLRPLKHHPHHSKTPRTPGRRVRVQFFLSKGYPCHSLDMASLPPTPPSVPHHIHNGWFSCLPPLCTPLHMFEILSFTNIEYIYFIQK